jgi:large subunit ribosomal protein L17
LQIADLESGICNLKSANQNKMRHGDKINNLGRKTAHRHALMMNMAIALIENKRIFTTLAKAKALRTYIEPLITKSKDDSTHSRRMAFSYLKNKEAVSILFKDVAVKVAERNGGYTRIIKTGNRQGDAAEMAMIELVDFNEIYNNKGKTAAEAAKPKTRRSRGAKKPGGIKTEGIDEAKGE